MIWFIVGILLGAAAAAALMEKRRRDAQKHEIDEELLRMRRIIEQQFRNMENYNGTEDGQEEISYE